MIITMKYTAHPERKTTFTKAVEASGRIHALIPKASPWRNGIIERTNRTDNDELFHQLRFTFSEERRYHLTLWEFFYNHQRLRQRLGGQIPIAVDKKGYRIHAGTRMLI